MINIDNIQSTLIKTGEPDIKISDTAKFIEESKQTPTINEISPPLDYNKRSVETPTIN